MDERKRELLAGAGIDVQDAMERFMQRDDLLERFMKKFLENAAFEDLKQAAAEGDCEKMLAASHYLKGMCANLSMTELTALFTGQVARLRSGDFSGAKEMMDEIRKAYGLVEEAIRGCWQ